MQIIQHTELGSAQTAITFSSIPSTYTDLVIYLSGRTARAGIHYSDIRIKINGSDANFTVRGLAGNGSSVSSFSAGNYAFAVPAATATSNTFSSNYLYIPNYTSSVAKSISIDDTMENNATTSEMTIRAMLWNQTAAITSIELYPDAAQSFQQYSSATLYGILKGSSGGVTVS